MFEQCPDLLTVKAVQDILQIGRSKVYGLIKKGELKSFKIGSSIRVPKASVIEYLESSCYNRPTVDGCSVPSEVIV